MVKTSRLVAKVPFHIHKKFKELAARLGTTQNWLLMNAMTEYITQSEQIPLGFPKPLSRNHSHNTRSSQDAK